MPARPSRWAASSRAGRCQPAWLGQVAFAILEEVGVGDVLAAGRGTGLRSRGPGLQRAPQLQEADLRPVLVAHAVREERFLLDRQRELVALPVRLADQEAVVASGVAAAEPEVLDLRKRHSEFSSKRVEGPGWTARLRGDDTTQAAPAGIPVTSSPYRTMPSTMPSVRAGTAMKRNVRSSPAEEPLRSVITRRGLLQTEPSR